LQKTKDIKLDGVRPVILSPVVISGKPAYSTNPDMYYFKTGETILFTLSASKPIMAQGTPILSYNVASAATNYTAFAYQRPGGSNAVVFALTVSPANCTADGQLLNVTLISPNGSRDIIDDVRNQVSSRNISSLLPVGASITIRQTPPPKPSATIDGKTFDTCDKVFNFKPELLIPKGDETIDTIEYSLNDGYSWVSFSNDFNITAEVPVGINKIKVRYKDRAGNESPEHKVEIEVKDTFPKLIQVSASNPGGWYKKADVSTTKPLTFNLAFEEEVRVVTAGNVSITLWNKSSDTPPTAGRKTLYAAAGQTGTTIKFNWTDISNQEMRDGLYIAAVDLSGLTDNYGNKGGSGYSFYNTVITITPVSGITNNYTCSNLPGVIKIDAVNPEIDLTKPDDGRTPKHNTTPSGNDLIKEIKLTFTEPVMKGSGMITIRPRQIDGYPQGAG